MSELAFGLLGSGEFEPWAAEVDRWLLDHARTGSGRVLVVPVASAPEGDEVFDGWAQRGLAHYAALGVPAEVVPIKTREDADQRAFADAIDGASVVFFSGGNPAYLAAALRETRFLEALLEAMDRGLAYGGCSAGWRDCRSWRPTARPSSLPSCGGRGWGSSAARWWLPTGTPSTGTFRGSGTSCSDRFPRDAA
jgi:cyanophycinase